MIIWSGWGILTLLIAVGVTALVNITGIAILRAMNMPPYLAGVSLAVGVLAAAVVNWFVGRRLNTQPGQELVDKATGQTVVLRRRHSLFFIPMEWWSVLLVAAALVMLFSAVFGTEAPSSGTGFKQF